MTKFLTSIFFIFVWALSAQAEPITYKVDDTDYEGFVVNKGQQAGLVFMIHDWDGLTDYEVKRAQMLGALGYSVFALDLFGKGVRPKEDKDKRQHTGELYKDREKMRRLLSAALAEAERLKLNINKAVAMGYCFGGAAVLEWARSGADLKSFISFHGGLSTPENQNYKMVKGDILVFHGTADAAISMGEFAELAKSLEESKVRHEMITYSGAPHAFSVFDSPNYRKDADEKSWKHFTDYLARLK